MQLNLGDMRTGTYENFDLYLCFEIIIEFFRGKIGKSVHEAVSDLDSKRQTDILWYPRLVGINLTKLYTLLYREKFFGNVVSVGRVQTPVLRMITDRALQHNSFIPVRIFIMSVSNI